MNSPAHALLWTGLNGRDADAADPGFRPGGVILFSRNLDPDPAAGPARCHALLAELQARWGQEAPLAVAVDQEGGPVSRLAPWVGPTPPLREVWIRGGAEACARWGSLWGRGLRLLGFHVDFAPVADLWDGRPGTGLGDRCASEEPLEAAQTAGAFLHGLESAGVRGCLKHFPGLGGTAVDSHQALPELKDMAQIARNLEVFRLLAHQERLVMVAHLRAPGTGGLPASLHRGSVAANPWGIRGRFLPDDLEMGGCAEWSWGDRARLCLEAGHMALLVCQTREGWEACAEAAARQPEARVRPALERFGAFRRGLAREAAPFDRGAWRAWADEVAREAAPKA